jgi:hypothetical protein
VAILLLIALAFAGGAVIDRSVGDSEDSSVNSTPDVVEEIDDVDEPDHLNESTLLLLPPRWAQAPSR